MTIENTSGLEPVGRALLVEPYEPEVKDSVIILAESARQSGHMLEMRARVIAIGPNCWPDEPPRCAVGDLVMVAKMSGALVVGPADKKQYRAINDRDVFLKIVNEGAK